MMRKVSVFIILLLSILFIISCNGDSPSETAYESYSVAVPQFLEGNSEIKTIDGSSLTADQQTLYNLYEFFPPIECFSTTSVTVGSTIDTTILGEPMSLTMSLDSDKNYVFEGNNNSDYFKNIINKDNTSFSFTHAISAWDGSFNIMPVIIGQGNITDSGYEADIDAFILSGNGTGQKVKALVKKDCSNYGYISYSGYTGNITPPSEDFDVNSYIQYVDEADTFESSMTNPYSVIFYDGTTISSPSIASFEEGLSEIADSGLSSWTPQDPSLNSEVSIVGLWNFTRNGKDAYMQLNADGTGIIHYYQYYGAGAGGLNAYVNILVLSWSYNSGSSSFSIATGNRFNPENYSAVTYIVTTLNETTLEMTKNGASKPEVPTSCTR